MKYGDNYVITGPGLVMWDGITRPEPKKDDKGQEYMQYSLKVALDSRSLEVQELTQIATVALQNDPKFRGQLPPGGNWPIVPIAPTDFEGKLPSHVSVNGKTTFLPDVFDVNNQKLPPQVYQPMLYPGATVKLLLSAKSFDNKSKGVKFQLSGIMIVDATTPRLPVGGVDAAAAFGGAGGGAPVPPVPAAPAAAAPPMPTPPPAPARPVMLPAAQGQSYAALIAAGWTDELLIQHGMMQAPAAPVAVAPPTPPTPPAPVVPPTAPNMQFVAGPGAPPPAPGYAPPAAPPVPPAPAAPVMTAKAAGVAYETFKAQGWNDQQLREQGYML